ncbi:beta-ketoacyl-[acyl-carrier-protein] synthase family protein [Paenibacillus tarimensis]|uniref:hypothetical protein n=1 Tax=Paenibacillus tarimensis TaxID=416012 RepID=UPI001F331E30|nr:hypothetical protein [Paenibacillus tarimensis]MCF2945164.1 hypothetical protein [Paenibacillus tarimensis]
MSRIGKSYYYLPKKRLSADKWARQSAMYPEISAHYEKHHMEPFHDASPNSGEDLIYKAIDGLQQRYAFKPSRVKYIALAYQVPCFPNMTDIFINIRKRYNFHHAECFSVRELYCAVPLMSLEVMLALSIRPSSANDLSIIVSVGRFYSPLFRVDGEYIAGDGSGALLLDNEIGDPILAVHNTMDTRVNLRDRSNIWDISYLISLKKVIEEAVDKSGISIDDIRLIIVNRAPLWVWSSLAKLLRVSEKLFYCGEPEIGHQFVNDIIVNYVSALQNRLLDTGDRYMLLCLGSFGVAGCAICSRDTTFEMGLG